MKGIFEKIQEEVQQTLGYRFFSKDQGLPSELERMRPEKKLDTTKKLEKLLEKKVMLSDYENVQKMQEIKSLFEYAQKCGVHSDDAKEFYGMVLYTKKKAGGQGMQRRILRKLEL